MRDKSLDDAPQTITNSNQVGTQRPVSAFDNDRAQFCRPIADFSEDDQIRQMQSASLQYDLLGKQMRLRLSSVTLFVGEMRKGPSVRFTLTRQDWHAATNAKTLTAKPSLNVFNRDDLARRKTSTTHHRLAVVPPDRVTQRV